MMPRFLGKFCIPRTPENVILVKYIIPGTVLSVLFGAAFSAYLIMEMQTTEQLLNLNLKLKTLRIDVETKQKIVEQLKIFNKDLMGNVNAYDKNFAQIKEGAFVETLFGKEIDPLMDGSKDRFVKILMMHLKLFLGLRSSLACNLLSSELSPKKFVTFQGDQAGLIIRLVAPVAIHTVIYDHLITDHRTGQQTLSAPKTMHLYGIKNVTMPPFLLGKFDLKVSRGSHHHQAVLHLDPKDFYQHIRFDIVSNHGHPERTIAYKLSIFGNQKPNW